MPELEQKTFQKRQVAYKLKISDIVNGNLTKEELSGDIKLSNFNVTRVNIIAALIYKSEELNYASAVIDDGTGRIQLRSFENNAYFSRIDVGDAVLIIGKIREFNSEKYIVPEILKRINDVKWADVRKLELRNSSISDNKTKGMDKNPVVAAKIDEEIYSLIKKLDNGDGASFDDIIKSRGIDAEKILNRLLENGDIFEIKPGKLKVLE
mgnify:FL=1